jgi:Glycosyl hydrolases family 43
VHWTDNGTLFNATTSTWQSRCAPRKSVNVYGNCFRPHMLYNASSKRYILWVKDYTAAYHFRVLSSTSPVGPFTELAVPTLAMTNAGDENLFADDNGTAYIVYTDRNHSYDLAIEQLNASYTSGTGKYIRLGLSKVEAPGMFKRNGIYYVQYSSPNCGYCGGTGTSYKTATSPLGTWSAGASITTTSCGGQPTHTAVISTPLGPLYLYQSDLWNSGAHNEALANYFWGPLSFNSNGSIGSLSCAASFHVTLSGGQPGSQLAIPGQDQSDGVAGFRTFCDVASNVQRLQTFTPSQSQKLSSVLLTTFQTGQPNAALHIDIVNVNAQGKPTQTLSANSIAASSVGWSARTITIAPNIAVTSGQRYGILIHSTTTKGCYGVAYNDSNLYPRGQELYSKNSGSSFAVETQRALKFVTTLHA